MYKQLYSANNPSTSCTNCVNFGPVTTEIKVWEICTFETIRQKSAYLTKYLISYWTSLHQRFSVGRNMYANYKTDIGFAVVHSKGRCYSNELILWDFLQTSKLTVFTLCSRVLKRNALSSCLMDVCINSSTNCSTSCKKMVKIGCVHFELNRGRKWKLCCDSAEIVRFCAGVTGLTRRDVSLPT